MLLPRQVLAALKPAARTNLLSTHFFPSLISRPFTDGLHMAFWLSVGLLVFALAASAARGRRYVHGEEARAEPRRPAGTAAMAGAAVAAQPEDGGSGE